MNVFIVWSNRTGRPAFVCLWGVCFTIRWYYSSRGCRHVWIGSKNSKKQQILSHWTIARQDLRSQISIWPFEWFWVNVSQGSIFLRYRCSHREPALATARNQCHCLVCYRCHHWKWVGKGSYIFRRTRSSNLQIEKRGDAAGKMCQILKVAIPIELLVSIPIEVDIYLVE